jgi:hypothetical protein
MDKLQLPPEYTLLEREGKFVLAFCPDNRLGRYATWMIGREGLMCHGHYFPGPKQAAIDFEMRCGKIMGALDAI